MKSNFIRCGMCGWCIEILWTGLHSLLNSDPKLTGTSSLHMFPIYGMAAVIAPLSRLLKHFKRVTRGLIYMFGIFAVEYTSGTFLQKLGWCPWDYSSCPFHINGVIRLDYAPLWFMTGLLFEKITQKEN